MITWRTVLFVALVGYALGLGRVALDTILHAVMKSQGF